MQSASVADSDSYVPIRKSDIDRLFAQFWAAELKDPRIFIEQMTIVMLVRILDIIETEDERFAERTGKSFERVFRGKDDPRRWQNRSKADHGAEATQSVGDNPARR